MLLATLRDGSPAPAPSKVMLASARPFLATAGNDPPLPSERPFTLGSASTRVAAQPTASDVTSVSRPQTRSVVRSPAAEVAESRAESPRPTGSAPAAGFAPMRNEGGSLGLMSGRGLY
jgi:rare lipoprotein A